jgi:Flp pilus assembly protein TadD
MIAKSAAGIPATDIGRNAPCPCGSGKKFKHCCRARESGTHQSGTTGRPTSAQRQRVQTMIRAAKQHGDEGRWYEANAVMQEVVRNDPSNPRAHHDLGLTYLHCGRPREAAASFERALSLQPGVGEPLRRLADALEQDGREAESLLACRKLGRTADDPLERRHFLGKALMMEGKFDEAESELRRVLALAPERTMTRILLARLLANRGEFEEVVNQLSQVVEALPSAFGQLTEAKRMTAADRPLIDRMCAVAERPGLSAMQRASVHFGLGKSFDDLGDYAGAMRHYLEANRLRALSARFDRASIVAMFDFLIATLGAESFAGLRRSLARPVSPGDELPLLVVGMPRSGTTLVEQILTCHPAVASAGELSFWDDRLKRWRLRRIGDLKVPAVAEVAEDYRALLRRFGPEAQRVVDKAPANFQRLWLIRLAFPEARIIHCRRHPVDTCLSNFFTNFLGRFDYAWDRGDLAFFYRQYQRLMNHWRAVLPADRFIEVEYERLIADREAETRRLVAFCGLDWDDACLAPERNHRAVQTASVWQTRQPVYNTSVDRWRNYEPWLGELRELLPAAKTP